MASSAPSGADEKGGFEENKFMKDLIHLRDTQEAIQGLSAWCIRNRKHAYKIARCWLKCIKKVKIDHKLTLFHLINDVVQHSRRRNHAELLEKLQGVAKEAMPHLKEPKICHKVLRCLHIWSERQIFEEPFIQSLSAIVDPSQNRKAEQDIIDNFQPQQLCTQIKIMKALEDDTDYKLKNYKESEVNMSEISLNAHHGDDGSDFPGISGKHAHNLKDRKHGNDYINEVEENRRHLEQYIKAIDREITKRRQVIELLTHGSKYYEGLLGEANIVANAYANFGKRVKSLNKKLEDRVANLEKNPPIPALASVRGSAESTPKLAANTAQVVVDDGDSGDFSPVPSPDYDAPSPQATDDMDLILPEDDGDHNNREGSQSRTKGGSDLNSRLDSMRSSMVASMASSPGQGEPNPDLQAPGETAPSTIPGMFNSSPDLSISAFLSKLAKNHRLPDDDDADQADPPEGAAAWWGSRGSNGSQPTLADGEGSGQLDHGWNQGDDDDDEDPPAATAWPAPRPDTWVTSYPAAAAGSSARMPDKDQQPVLEWQMQDEEEPLFEDQDVEDGIDEDGQQDQQHQYTENLALQRLMKKSIIGHPSNGSSGPSSAAAVAGPSNCSIQGLAQGQNLIDLTNTDMEMCSDDEDFDTFAHQQLEQIHHNRDPYAPKDPEPLTREQELERQRTLSLQDRLRSLAGVPTSSEQLEPTVAAVHQGGPPPSLPHQPPPMHHHYPYQHHPPQPHPRHQQFFRGGHPRGGGPPYPGPRMPGNRGGGSSTMHGRFPGLHRGGGYRGGPRPYPPSRGGPPRW